MLDSLRGNEALRQHLKQALESGKLAHCILLCGEEGAGAGFAARCLAADRLYPNGGDGARQVMQNASPEYLVLSGEGASGEIKTERVRTIRREIYNTSFSANGRVVHIKGAQNLNTGSANALLKVLEEPPEGATFILTAPSEAAVLPTIRSRCSAYSLAPVAERECANWVCEQFPAKKAEAAKLAAIFGGKIGAIQKCLANDAEQKKLDDAFLLARAFAAHERYSALRVLAGYEKDRASARAFLALFRSLAAAALRANTVAECALTPQQAAVCLTKTQQADAALARSGNTKLMLTCFAACAM